MSKCYICDKQLRPGTWIDGQKYCEDCLKMAVRLLLILSEAGFACVNSDCDRKEIDRCNG